MKCAVLGTVLVAYGCSGGSDGSSSLASSAAVPQSVATENAASAVAASAAAVADATDIASPDAAGPGVVVSATAGPPISRLVLGANMANWFDVTQSGVAASFQNAGFAATRWPGGSESDQFHWQANALCGGGYVSPNSTFDTFMHDVALPAALDVAVTLNYGSNSACNAGGSPSEAAAWVAEAKANNYGVHYWTVGNEVYGSWEYDLHARPHDPGTYASAVSTGYYPAVKAQDPTAQVGVVVEPGAGWDQTVLANAKYDFVEYHYYAQAPGSESDTYLLANAPAALTQGVQQVKNDLATAGHASTPIYVGELGSVYANPGKQSTSIVQALFAGMAVSELLNDGVFRATWWLAYGGCNDASGGGNFSSSLYGWQNFGGYMMFSDGTPEYGCSNATSVPLGTPLPTVRAYQLLSQVAQNGEHVLGTTVPSGYANVRAYAATHGSGYALTLFNLKENAPVTLPVAIAGLTHGSSVQLTTYGKAQYDLSQNNVWAGPVSHTKGAFKGRLSFTLPPWSMTVAIVNP